MAAFPPSRPRLLTPSAAAVRVVMSMILLFTVAVLTGMEVGAHPGELAGLALLSLVACLAAALWGIGVALRLQTVHAAPLLQVPVFLTLFLCPTFVPLDQLTGWIHAVALANPVTWFLEAGRGLLTGHADATDLRNAALAGTAFLLATGLWALSALRTVENRR